MGRTIGFAKERNELYYFEDLSRSDWSLVGYNTSYNSCNPIHLSQI